jgi:hypothetical protein
MPGKSAAVTAGRGWEPTAVLSEVIWHLHGLAIIVLSCCDGKRERETVRRFGMGDAMVEVDEIWRWPSL